MALLSLSASHLDPGFRIGAFQDAVAAMCRLEITPEDVEGFHSRTVIGALPEVILGRTVHSPCTAVRTPALAAGGTDNVMIHVPRSGAFRMRQRGGEEIICRPGEIYIDPNEVDGTASFLAADNDVFYIALPRRLLAGLRGLDTHLRRRVEPTPQWRLFLRYGALVLDELAELPPDQVARSARHLQDLALAAFGEGDAAALPGTMAARLRLIREDIEAWLDLPDLAPGFIAARHGISTRYLRALFAAEGSSFRGHVLERRLQRAHAALCAPEAAARTIADVAGDAGFGDLSWFSTCYRRRFGRTPRETRALALETFLRRRAAAE